MGMYEIRLLNFTLAYIRDSAQYIHGSQPTSHYLALDPSYKNPAMTTETHGLKATIDSGATWNSQMERYARSNY